MPPDWRSPEEPEEGGRVFQVDAAGGKLELRFGNGALDARPHPAAATWCGARTIPTSIRLRRRFLEPARAGAQAARAGARGGAGRRAAGHGMDASARSQCSVSFRSAAGGRARPPASTCEYLREQFGRLGNTPYELAEVELDVRGSPVRAGSMLNQCGGEAVEQLQERCRRRTASGSG